MNIGQWTPTKKIGDKVTLNDLQPSVLAFDIDFQKSLNTRHIAVMINGIHSLGKPFLH